LSWFLVGLLLVFSRFLVFSWLLVFSRFLATTLLLVFSRFLVFSGLLVASLPLVASGFLSFGGAPHGGAVECAVEQLVLDVTYSSVSNEVSIQLDPCFTQAVD
jgi:hypothetical protein